MMLTIIIVAGYSSVFYTFVYREREANQELMERKGISVNLV